MGKHDRRPPDKQYINNETIREQRPLKVRFGPCDVTSTLYKCLMTGDGDFVETGEQIEKECICPNKNTCQIAIEYVRQNMIIEAMDVLSTIKKP